MIADLHAVPLPGLREERDGPQRRHGPRGRPPHGPGHPHRGRALPGRHRAQAQGRGLPLPRPPHLPRRRHGGRAEALRHVPRAPDAHLPGRLPQQPGLRALVRLERDAARPLRDPRARQGDARAPPRSRRRPGPRGRSRDRTRRPPWTPSSSSWTSTSSSSAPSTPSRPSPSSMAKGGDDREELSRFVRFIREFADARHHGKEEDILFRAMVAAGFPADGGPIAVMLMDHEAGREHVRVMAGRAGQAAPWTAGDRAEAIDASRGLRGAPARPHPQGGPHPLPDGPAAPPGGGCCARWTGTAPPSRSGRSRRGRNALKDLGRELVERHVRIAA